MPEIILTNVSKKWGDFYGVKDLSMTIEDRDFVTLLGPSGCGKTTTLRMIAGLEHPTTGRITIDGIPVFDSEQGIRVDPSKRDVGFVFQNYALWPHMTVYKNISFGLENAKWKKKDIEDRVREILGLLKIEQFADRYPSELSGGQQQRVAIARTLAPRPKVLFMDEPLSNLDAKLRNEMRTELKRLHRDTNSTFVYVTHDQLEAMTLATKVCLMKEGELQQYDPPLKTYSSPNNLFVADFVGNPTMNLFPVERIGTDGETLTLSLAGITLRYLPGERIAEAGEKLILGIRPEFLQIRDGGRIPGRVYSTLPAGMETTVKADIGNGTMLTSVVFGNVDYEADRPIRMDMEGDQILLFDAETTKRVAIGSVEVMERQPA